MRNKAAIYLSSFNKGKYIMDAINSALNQTATFPYKLYIRDSSTDLRTRRFLERLPKGIGNKIEIEFKNEKEHITGLNWFYEHYDAEYLFNLADDDVLQPNFLEQMVTELEKGREAVYCGWIDRRKDSVDVYPAELIYPNTIKSMAGNMEWLQLGFRKSFFQKLQQPYHEIFDKTHVAEVITKVHRFMQRIESTTPVYPVTGEALYIHRWTELSTWCH